MVGPAVVWFCRKCVRFLKDDEVDNPEDHCDTCECKQVATHVDNNFYQDTVETHNVSQYTTVEALNRLLYRLHGLIQHNDLKEPEGLNMSTSI